MNKQKLFLIIASSMGLVSVFLPWKKATLLVLDMSVNGLQYLEGMLVLTMFGGVLALCLMGAQKTVLTTLYKGAIAAAGIVAVVVSVMKIFSLKSEFNKISDVSSLSQVPENAITNMAKVSIGTGIYLSVVAGLAVTAIALLIKNPKELTPADSETKTTGK